MFLHEKVNEVEPELGDSMSSGRRTFTAAPAFLNEKTHLPPNSYPKIEETDSAHRCEADAGGRRREIRTRIPIFGVEAEFEHGGSSRRSHERFQSGADAHARRTSMPQKVKLEQIHLPCHAPKKRPETKIFAPNIEISGVSRQISARIEMSKRLNQSRVTPPIDLNEIIQYTRSSTDRALGTAAARWTSANEVGWARGKERRRALREQRKEGDGDDNRTSAWRHRRGVGTGGKGRKVEGKKGEWTTKRNGAGRTGMEGMIRVAKEGDRNAPRASLHQQNPDFLEPLERYIVGVCAHHVSISILALTQDAGIPKRIPPPHPRTLQTGMLHIVAAAMQASAGEGHHHKQITQMGTIDGVRTAGRAKRRAQALRAWRRGRQHLGASQLKLSSEERVVVLEYAPVLGANTKRLGSRLEPAPHIIDTTQVTWEKIQLRVLETRAMVEAGLSREPSRGNTSALSSEAFGHGLAVEQVVIEQSSIIVALEGVGEKRPGVAGTRVYGI
ncbi:hypothetical protein DFH06DRAFT_1139828 [Mycena polygramma]|nr:hypothetical protein DFH06DRAFT_1139828 [Mycena polygramma]